MDATKFSTSKSDFKLKYEANFKQKLWVGRKSSYTPGLLITPYKIIDTKNSVK